MRMSWFSGSLFVDVVCAVAHIIFYGKLSVIIHRMLNDGNRTLGRHQILNVYTKLQYCNNNEKNVEILRIANNWNCHLEHFIS